MVVIGAGVGGLATSARIMSGLSDACQGVEVVVLEKNHRERAGGRCGSFDVDVNGVGNFRHERGPSLLLLKDEYARLFADCGVRSQRGSTIAEAGVGTGGGGEDDDDDEDAAARAYGLETRQCVPAYQVVFDDGDVVPLGFPSSLPGCFSSDEATTVRDAERKSMRMLDSMEPGGYAKWRDYLDTCAAYLDCGLPNFIEGRLDLSSLPRFLRESLRDGGRRWPLAPHSTMLSSLFDSPKLRALASFQNLYVGLEPYANPRQFGGGVLRKTAPAVFGLLAALELHPSNGRAGVHAPVGGFRRVSESMAELCRDLGVEVRYGASVTRVTEDGVHFVYAAENDEASDRGGTEGKKGFLAADLIVCNADVPYATETILRSETDANGGRTTGEDDARSYQETYDWNDELDYSSGVIAFHWSVSRRLEGLSTHNVFMSANATSDAERSWAALRGDDDGGATRTSPMAGTPFNFYVHRAGKTDPTACPPGCDSIMVLVPCPKLTRNERLASLPRDEAIDAYKRQFDREVVDDARDAVFQRLSVLEGLENLEDSILDEVVDTPGSYADYYNVGAGVPFGLVSPSRVYVAIILLSSGIA